MKTIARTYTPSLLLALLPLIATLTGCLAEGDQTYNPPALADSSVQAYVAEREIFPFPIPNTGGGELQRCEVSPALPAGLTLTLSANQSTCEINGTPLSPQATSTVYTITATNASDVSSAAWTLERIYSAPASLNDISFAPTKTFSFDWSASADADHFQLLEVIDSNTEFVTIADSRGTGLTYDHLVPLWKRINARYRVQTCYSTDDSLCLDSNEVAVNNAQELTPSIGLVRGSNTESYQAPGRNSADSDGFGEAIALSANGMILAIGAPEEDSNASGVNNSSDGNHTSHIDSGAVYIFERIGNQWVQQSYIKSNIPAAEERFGSKIALSTDGATLAVSTGRYSTVPETISIFTRSPTVGWGASTTISLPNAGQTNYLPSLALNHAGDVLAVGLMGHDSIATNSGAALIYRKNITWYLSATLKASNAEEDADLGFSVDLNNVGDTLIVGARGYDNNRGSAYIFGYHSSTDLWFEGAILQPSNISAFRLMGASVTINDVGNTVAVSTQSSDGLVNSAHVFTRESSVWNYHSFIELPPLVYGSNINPFYLGFIKQVSSDLVFNATGTSLVLSERRQLLLGSGINSDSTEVFDDSAKPAYKGAAFIFDLNDAGTQWSQRAYIKASNADEVFGFGKSIALSGDGSTLAVGADRAPNGGAAYLY